MQNASFVFDILTFLVKLSIYITFGTIRRSYWTSGNIKALTPFEEVGLIFYFCLLIFCVEVLNILKIDLNGF